MANKDFKIGAKLTLDGEQEFKKSLSDINKEMKNCETQAKLTSAQYDENTSTMKKLADAQETASQKVEIQQKKVDQLKQILKEIDSQNLNGTDVWRKYAGQLATAEQRLSKLQEQASNAEKEYKSHNKVIEGLNDQYNKMVSSVNKLADEHPKLAKGFETASSGAKALASGLGDGLKVAGSVAVGAIGAVTAGAVALGKAIFDSAEQASQYGDAVDKASQKMGVSAEQYQELAYWADLSGTSTQALQRATNALQKSGSDLDMSTALEQLYAIEDADERASKAQEMFGTKIANELAPMLNSGGKAFAEATKTAQDFGLVMSDDAVKASAMFNDTKTTMLGTVSMIKTNLSAELMPGINTVMEGITGLFTGDESATDKIEEGVNDLMDDMGTVIEKVSGILINIVTAITDKAPELIGALVTGLIDNLDKLIDCAFTLIDALVNGLLTKENITTIMNGAVSLIVKLVEFLSGNAGLLVDSAIIIVTTLIEAFSKPENSKKLVDGSIDMIKSIVTALIDNAPLLMNSAIEMGKELVKGLATYDWSSLAKSIYKSIKNSIIGLFKGDGEIDGSHAGGISYVPYNGYTAVLHQGEQVLTASEAQANRQSTDLSVVEAKLDYLMNNQRQADVNVNISGSAGSIVRALNIDIERENKRRSAW